MSQLNLIIGPALLQEYDAEKEREEERERKTRLLKALEDKFTVGVAALQKYTFHLSHKIEIVSFRQELICCALMSYSCI